MAEKRLPVRDLKVGDKIPFAAISPGAGRAEFAFCVRWRGAKPVEIFITPLQQPAATESYRVRVYDRTMRVFSWSHKGLDQPYIWLHFWCQEHGCPAFRAYVPPGSTHLQLVHDGDLVFDRIPETQKKPADPAEAEPAG